MKNEDFDRLLETLAKTYAEEEGRLLNQEVASMPGPALTPTMDKRVLSATRKRKNVKVFVGLGALAAAIALVLLTPPLLRYGAYKSLAGELANPTASAQSAADGIAMESNSQTDNEAEETASRQDSAKTEPSDSAVPPETLRLETALLPSRFSVAKEDTDNGKRVYVLSDTGHDDAVLVMEEGMAIDTAGLIAITLDGKPAYAINNADVKLITFVKDGVIYTLTCRYDLNTLTELGGKLIVDN